MRQPLVIIDPDQQFFDQHPSRKSHIRNAIGDEENGQFMSLGPHDRSRRRIISWKVPPGTSKAWDRKILTFPLLAFSDETIEDEDCILLPMIDEVMKDAAKSLGIPIPKVK